MKSQHRKDMENMVPPGPYCYVIDYTKPEFQSLSFEKDFPVVYCPHYTSKELNNVRIAWCALINKGGISDNYSNDDWKRLIEYFGNEDNMFNFLSHDLLSNACKECGLENEYHYTKEDIIAWINKVKRLYDL